MASALAFPMPLVPIVPGIWALELFHGPTLAFKDVGARSMARWLAATAQAGDGGDPLTVLVATSGDTGGAVAHAFHGVAGTRVVVLYPRGRVSPVQEAQFATLGDNVTAVAVEGTFDDCQRLVKEAFSDARAGRPPPAHLGQLDQRRAAAAADGLLRVGGAAVAGRRAAADGGRAERQPRQRHRRPAGGAPRRADRPLRRRHHRQRSAAALSSPRAATSRPPPCRRWPTPWTSAHPSNFERLRWLFDGDLEAMRRAVVGVTVTDDEIRAAMRELAGARLHRRSAHRRRLGRRHGGDRFAGPEVPRVVLATAHPAKFGEVVAPVLGRDLELPPALAERLAHPPLAIPAPRRCRRLPACWTHSADPPSLEPIATGVGDALAAGG